MSLTDQQRLFARIAAETGDKAEAARRSGYSRAGSSVAKGAKVAAEILRLQREFLVTEGLPLANRTLIELLGHSAWAARLGAAKAIHAAVAESGLLLDANAEAHAMSADQLREAIAKLAAELDAPRVIDHEAEDAEVVPGANGSADPF